MVEKDKKEKVNILFVCTGNTCRSPMAEQIFTDYMRKNKCMHMVNISSAGLFADNGSPISPEAAGVLSEMDIIVYPHRSRKVSVDILQNSDIVVCMTEEHREMLLDSDTYAFASSDGISRVIGTVRELTGEDVSDPYGKGVEEYRKTAECLVKMCEPLFQQVKKFRDENKIKLL